MVETHLRTKLKVNPTEKINLYHQANYKIKTSSQSGTIRLHYSLKMASILRPLTPEFKNQWRQFPISCHVKWYQQGHLDTLNAKIHPLGMKWATAVGLE